MSKALRQAQAEMTLVVTENKTGYYGVYLSKPGQPNPYEAQLRRGGRKVSLGSFATAEEAALCVARSPEGQAIAAKRAAAVAPLTSEEARQQAQAEELTLLVAENKTGYHAGYLNKPGRPKPYLAAVWRGGKLVSLGSFATAEEAALYVARSPEGPVAAERAAAAPPLTSEEARQQAQAEGVTLLVAENKAGYSGVTHNPGKLKPYQARVKRGGKTVHLWAASPPPRRRRCASRDRQRGRRRLEGRRRRRVRARSLPCRPAPPSRRRARSRLCRPAHSSRRKAWSRPCLPMHSPRLRSSSRRRSALAVGRRGNG
eukprot:scaffold50088_cov60-Phaeocystis_antarctica.AAC.2